MANFELKFFSNDDQDYSIKCWCQLEEQIVITTEHPDGQTTICLDKSTAIKFAKTLRTEINKINNE